MTNVKKGFILYFNNKTFVLKDQSLLFPVFVLNVMYDF